MATAKQIKALVESHADGDDARFFSVAMQLAAQEARSGHGRFAKELRELIDQARERLGRPPTTPQKTVPISQPRGELAGLMSVAYPATRLGEMVLEGTVRDRLNHVLSELGQRHKLEEFGLAPCRKLLLVGPPGTGKTMSAAALAGDTLLPVERLRTHGATVLSIKREGNVEKAAVFMPEKAVTQFLNKFDRYQTTDTKSGRPSNEDLARPIETVGEADLRSLWTDDPSSFPATEQEIWWEVWLCRDSESGNELDRFREFAAQVGIQVRLDTPLLFPERTVLLTYSSPARLASALDSVGDIAELRSARPSPQSFLDMSAREQSELTRAIADRTGPAPPDDAPAVCLLDTGVNAEHPLLHQFLSPADTHVYDPSWDAKDFRRRRRPRTPEVSV